MALGRAITDLKVMKLSLSLFSVSIILYHQLADTIQLIRLTNCPMKLLYAIRPRFFYALLRYLSRGATIRYV